MKTILISFLCAVAGAFCGAQTTISGSFEYGGITRTYSFYVPASYNPGQAVPLVLNLHGLSTDGAYQAQYRDFRPIADTANFIVAHPDGSMLLGQRFWNYGSVFGSTVDDVGFLEALIDTIALQYAINPERVYAAGMSNGSFMCYYLACQSDRFAAIGTVTGSMSVDMYNSCNPGHPTPAIHIHGTEDGINPYDGTSTMEGVENVAVFWADQNGCGTNPSVMAVPDTDPGDNATAERFLYAGGVNGHTVELFKVTGGGHAWPGSPVPGSTENTCMDFSASKEIWRFFSQYERAAENAVGEMEYVEVSLWPNPVQNYLNIAAGDQVVKQVKVTDMQGRLVARASGAELSQMYLGDLVPGRYIAIISGDSFLAVKALLVASIDE